jgi:hypothetical protein
MLRTAVRLKSCKSLIPNPALPQAFFNSLSKRFSRSVPFDGDFGAAELGPGKQRPAQRYGAAVQRQQFVFEPELLDLTWRRHLAPLIGPNT